PLLKKIFVNLIPDSEEPIFVDLSTDSEKPRLSLCRTISEKRSLGLGLRRTLPEMRSFGFCLRGTILEMHCLRLGSSNSMFSGLKFLRDALDAIDSACAIFLGFIRCTTHHFDYGIARPIKYLGSVRFLCYFGQHTKDRSVFTVQLFGHFRNPF